LKRFRDGYFLPARLGHTYPARHLTTQAREMMSAWAQSGDIYAGLSEFAVWKSKDMVKRAAEKLGSSRSQEGE